ncbi:MAG: hypothetical protein MUF21_02990 [Gemmatimonadaceae bacterium]|nr:hypothetical protein [Gemmatimonadaceae bacterium]
MGGLAGPEAMRQPPMSSAVVFGLRISNHSPTSSVTRLGSAMISVMTGGRMLAWASPSEVSVRDEASGSAPWSAQAAASTSALARPACRARRRRRGVGTVDHGW